MSESPSPPERRQSAPLEPGVPRQVTITLKDQSNNETNFKIKMTTKLEKVFQAYCARESKDRNAVRFLFDGQRLGGDVTPEELDMVDEDIIDVFMEQLGGCGE